MAAWATRLRYKSDSIHNPLFLFCIFSKVSACVGAPHE
jgi:hypothetical protein